MRVVAMTPNLYPGILDQHNWTSGGKLLQAKLSSIATWTLTVVLPRDSRVSRSGAKLQSSDWFICLSDENLKLT
jgi:hypothetical protein